MIALVLLFADFSLGYASDETGIPILIGKHKDFDTDWFYDVGAKISFAMVTNSISPYFSRIFQPIVMGLLRCILDRGCKKHLRKLTNWEKDHPNKGGSADQEAEEEPEEDQEEEDDEEEGQGKKEGGELQSNYRRKKRRSRQYEGGESGEDEDGQDERQDG